MKKFTDKINESVDGKVPTAEEFLQNSDKTTFNAIENTMVEFAKLHVEAALKSASCSAEIESCGNPYDPSDDSKCVSEKSILNAYPLDNIK